MENKFELNLKSRSESVESYTDDFIKELELRIRNSESNQDFKLSESTIQFIKYSFMKRHSDTMSDVIKNEYQEILRLKLELYKKSLASKSIDSINLSESTAMNIRSILGQ